jgi:predicted nucleotidyltransferase
MPITLGAIDWPRSLAMGSVLRPGSAAPALGRGRSGLSGIVNCGTLNAVRANVEPLKIQLASVWPLFPCLELAMVFGSVATGQSTVNSDLDVAVIGKGLDTLDLIRALENRQPREVHIIQLDQPSVVLLSELSRDARPLYERLPGAFANWLSKTMWQLEDDLPWYHRQQTAWLARVARKAS